MSTSVEDREDRVIDKVNSETEEKVEVDKNTLKL